MYIEKRGSKQYLYKAVREGKLVKKVYVGTGVCAQQLLVLQKLSREKIAFEEKIAEARKAALWPLQQRMGLLRAEAKQGLEALYYATGHYRSRCRHWRRSKMDIDKAPELALHSGKHEAAAGQPELSEARTAQLNGDARLRSLCDQIKAGKTHLRPSLRQLLREEDPEDIKRIADLTELLADRWASQIAPNSEIARASIVVDAMDKCRALAPPSSTPIEKILAGRVVLSSLQQTCHELRMTAVVGDVDVVGSKIFNAMSKQLAVATREQANATKNYQKGVELAAEITPPRPQSGVAALKVYNPDQKRKSA